MILDILVIIVLLISASIAFVRGFIREVLTILGVGGGAGAAYFGGPHLKPTIADWLGIQEGVDSGRFLGVLPYPILADILSYGLIFLVVVIILSLVSHALAEGARAVGLGAIDRTLGFVFGLLRGAVVLGLLYLPFHFILSEENKKEWFSDSKSLVYLDQTAEAMAALIPKGTAEQAQEQAEKATSNAARQALEKIDLLKTAPSDVKTPTAKQDQNQEGYADDFRDQMDRIFEDTMPASGSNEDKNVENDETTKR